MAKRKKQVPQADTVDEEDGPVQGNDATATLTWKRWRASRTHLSDWRKEAVTCYDFTAGHQWTAEEKEALKQDLRPAVTFNRTGVVIDSVSGYEINNRQDIAYLPRETDDAGPVQVETEAAKYYRQNCDAEDEESDSFVDLLTCGYGWVEHRMDFEEDPDGMMKVERIDGLEMGYDPSATKRNISDRRWDIRGKWWDIAVAKATFPKADFTSGNIAGDDDALDGSSPSIREEQPFYRDTGAGQQSDRRRDKVFILEHTWFEREPYMRAINPQTGKLEDAKPETVDALNERLVTSGQPKMKSVRSTRKKFKRAFVFGKDTIDGPEDAPCPHRFHYQAMTGKRDRNKNVFFGLVRSMKDPQEWANKFMSQTMHMINSNAKGGLIHDKGAFENPADIEKRMAKPGWRLEKNQGYEADFVPPTPIPNNIFQLMTFAIGSLRDTTGVNLELLGLTDRDQPGILEHSRKQSAMAILAPFFDAMRRYHKEAGRLTLYFIKEFMSDGRKIRIVSQGQRQFVPLTNVQDFTKYDVVVDQSPTSPNSMEATWAVLGPMLPNLLKMGLPIPPDIVDYIPGLPADLKETWKKMLVQAKQPNPMAEMAQQLELKGKAAEVSKTEAEAAKVGAEAQNVGNEAQVQAQGQAMDMQSRQQEAQIKGAEQVMDLQAQQEERAFERDKMDFEREKWAFEKWKMGVQAQGDVLAHEHDREMGDLKLKEANKKANERPNAN